MKLGDFGALNNRALRQRISILEDRLNALEASVIEMNTDFIEMVKITAFLNDTLASMKGVQETDELTDLLAKSTKGQVH